MLSISKATLVSLTAVSVVLLSACATQAPRVINSELGYAVTNYTIEADANELSLSNALDTSLSSIGVVTAMPAGAKVTIDNVRYNSPIIGFFYGGQHYASLSVTLTDSSGIKISNFPINVASSGARSLADAELASETAQIIAAAAANAYMPMKAVSKPINKPLVVAPAITVIAQPVKELPIIDVGSPVYDDVNPCVIGPDGKCLVF